MKGGFSTDKKEEQVPIFVYDNVCEKAKEAGISINSLEKKAKLSIGSVCKWNTVSPTVKSLLKVANLLGCSVDDLLRTKV